MKELVQSTKGQSST